MSRRILIVSYFFPPLGGTGGYRAVKLVKHLPRFGFEVAVLTPRVPSYYCFDPSLTSEIPVTTRVVRSASLDPFRLYAVFSGPGEDGDRASRASRGALFRRLTGVAKSVNTWLFLPDNSAGWLPFAVPAGKRFLRSEGADLIVSLSVPHTDHLVARALRRATGIPWIADFRDEWVANPDLVPPTPVHRAIQTRLARSVLREADGVVAANDTVRRLLEGLLPIPRPGRFETVHNGFDEEDFAGLDPGGPSPGGRARPFTMHFSGTFHRRLDPGPVFAGIARALASERIPRGDFRLEVVGAQQDRLPPLLAEAGIADVTALAGFRPHREALRLMAAADLLLLLVSRTPGAEMYSTGKLYEYLRTGRPILVAAPDGEATALVSECRAGAVAPPDDPDAIAERIVAAYASREANRGRFVADRAAVMEYEFARQTERFLRFAEPLIASRQ